MSDIVERLRACHGIQAGDPECYCAEAAEEIERLRRALHPFAQKAKWLSQNHLDGHAKDEDEIYVRVGDLRWAACTLEWSS